MWGANAPGTATAQAQVRRHEHDGEPGQPGSELGPPPQRTARMAGSAVTLSDSNCDTCVPADTPADYER